MDVGTYRNGIKAYTSFFLHLYDFLVIGIFTRFFWKCEGRHYVDIIQSASAACSTVRRTPGS